MQSVCASELRTTRRLLETSRGNDRAASREEVAGLWCLRPVLHRKLINHW